MLYLLVLFKFLNICIYFQISLVSLTNLVGFPPLRIPVLLAAIKPT